MFETTNTLVDVNTSHEPTAAMVAQTGQMQQSTEPVPKATTTKTPSYLSEPITGTIESSQTSKAEVTTEITSKVAQKLRQSILKNYYRDIRKLRRKLTFKKVSNMFVKFFLKFC